MLFDRFLTVTEAKELKFLLDCMHMPCPYEKNPEKQATRKLEYKEHVSIRKQWNRFLKSLYKEFLNPSLPRSCGWLYCALRFDLLLTDI